MTLVGCVDVNVQNLVYYHMVSTCLLTAALSLARVSHIKRLTSTRSPRRGCRGRSAVPGRTCVIVISWGPVEWNHFPAQGGVERPQLFGGTNVTVLSRHSSEPDLLTSSLTAAEGRCVWCLMSGAGPLDLARPLWAPAPGPHPQVHTVY